MWCGAQVREETSASKVGCVLRFLDHVKNEDSPGPSVGSHHAFFSDDQEPYPVTDIADLIRDSYEVTGPGPIPTLALLETCSEVGFEGSSLTTTTFLCLYAKMDSVHE